MSQLPTTRPPPRCSAARTPPSATRVSWRWSVTLAGALLLLSGTALGSPRPAVGSARAKITSGPEADGPMRLLWIPEQVPSETLLSSLTHPSPEDSTPARVPADDARRERIVAAAVRLLETRTRFRDCSSFVQRVFRLAGETVTPVPLPAGRSLSESMFRASRAVETPRPGDIAVFHNTYDANRDGKRNDRFTHISVVEAVEGDVVTLIHRGGRGLARHRMNLAAPDDEATNDPLRRRPRGSTMQVLAGQLFAGYGDLLTEAGPEPIR